VPAELTSAIVRIRENAMIRALAAVARQVGPRR
jgi:hypothetical protein